MRSLASAIAAGSNVVVVSRVLTVATRDDFRLRISDAMFEPVWAPDDIMARPPTSAVLGRSVNPMRRTAGFAFILAASVREDRPTLRTADSKLLRVSEFVCERDTAAERFATRVADSDASAETVRDTLRTAVRVELSDVVMRDAVARADVDVTFSVFARKSASTVGVVAVSVPGIMRDTAPTAIYGSAVSATKKPNVNPFIFAYNYITNNHQIKGESGPQNFIGCAHAAPVFS